MKLKSIQWLRGIAVLLVVYSHSINLQHEFSISLQQNIFHLWKFGAIGADLFFVISGFIISYVTDRLYGLKAGLLFLHKRILRIYPVYYIITFFQIILYFIFLPNFHLGSIIEYLRDSLILIPILNNQNVMLIIITAWTLEFEWYFYIISFILIVLKVKSKATRLLIFIPIIILLGQIIRWEDIRLKMMSNPIMLEFLWGVIIYILYLKIKPGKRLCYFIFILAIFMAYYNIIWGYPSYVPDFFAVLLNNSGLTRSLLWGIPCALFVWSCIFIEKMKLKEFIFDNKIMQLIGNASYSIYLLNMPLEFLLRSIYKKVGFFLLPDVSILFHLIFYVGAGILFYLLIEKPLLKITIHSN